MANLTPNTATTPYCTAAVSLQFHDGDQICQLLRDGDGPSPSRLAILDATSTAGAMWKNMLLAASGDIESACLVGERYDPLDLAAFAAKAVTDAVPNSGLMFVQKLCADLAFWAASQRRQPGIDPDKVPGAKQAKVMLEAIGDGKRIFPFLEAEAAGLPVTVDPLPGGTGRIGQGKTARIFGSHGLGPYYRGWC